MSEDSIASDSISCRSEANAPLLPPRKRLLAGFKQNGWPSPSSSSCAPAAYAPPRAKEAFALASSTKAEVLDQNSGDAADGDFLNGRGSLQSLNGAAESLDSHSKSQRTPKRRRAPSPLTMKKSAKKKKKKKKKSASPESDGHCLEVAVDVVKSCLVGDKMKLSVASLTSSEVEEHSIALIGGEEFKEKEERFTTANGEVSAEHPMNVKPGSYSGSVNKEEEVATCDEAPKRSRNPARKTIIDIEKRTRADATKKHRKTSNGQKQKKIKKAGHKKLDMQPEKVVRMPLPLADEELARQLHRAMNSSPRIARCLSPKKERPLLASSQKRFSGS